MEKVPLNSNNDFSNFKNWNIQDLSQIQKFLVKSSFIVGSGGVIFGYDIGIISGTLNQLKDTFDLNSWEEGIIVSCICIGSVIGCIVGGPLCDRIGRWYGIHIQNCIFIIGAIIISLATSIEYVYIGRIVVGIASAISGIADCSYLNEISPSKYRGRISSMYEILTCIGVLLSFIVSYALSDLTNSWRIMFAIPAVMAFLQSCGMLYLPETPKWLAHHGYRMECDDVLLLMYGSKDDASEVYLEIEEECLVYSAPNGYDSNKTNRQTRHVAVLHGENTPNSECINPISEHGECADDTLNRSNVYSDNVIEGHPFKWIERYSPGDHRYVSISRGGGGDTVKEHECTSEPIDVSNTGDLGKSTFSAIENVTPSNTSGHNILLDPILTRASEVDPNAISGDMDVEADHSRGSIVSNRSDNDDSSFAAHVQHEWTHYQYALFIVIMLQVWSQITGGIVIRNYAPIIFENAGISDKYSLLLNIYLGFIKLLVVVIAVNYVDHVGRKPLLQYGCVIIGSGLLLLTIGFALGFNESPIMFMCGCSLTVSGYSLGFGPVNWILSSEMFPTVIKGRALSLSVIITNIVQFMINLIFLPLADLVSIECTFLIFFLFTCMSWCFITLYFVETNGLSSLVILNHLHASYSNANIFHQCSQFYQHKIKNNI